MKSGARTFRDASEEMWASLHVPFDDGFVLMEKSIEMDPGFKEFHQYCTANGFPFNVISAGLKPILRRVLDMALGEKQVRRKAQPCLKTHILILISISPVLRNRNRCQRRDNLTRRPVLETNLAPRLHPRPRQRRLHHRRPQISPSGMRPRRDAAYSLHRRRRLRPRRRPRSGRSLRAARPPPRRILPRTEYPLHPIRYLLRHQARD